MIGEKLASLRKRANMTQSELARKLHVHSKSIKNWESDTSDPTIENLFEICHFFHVSADDVLGIDSKDGISLSMLNDTDRRHLTAAIQAYIDDCIRSYKQQS